MIEKNLPPQNYVHKINQHLRDVMERGSSAEVRDDGIIIIDQEDIIAMVEHLQTLGYDWMGNPLTQPCTEIPAVSEAQRIIARSRFGHEPPTP